MEMSEPAFIHAVVYNNSEIIMWAIANGVDVNFQDRVAYSALHFAVQNGSFESAKTLIDRGKRKHAGYTRTFLYGQQC